MRVAIFTNVLYPILYAKIPNVSQSHAGGKSRVIRQLQTSPRCICAGARGKQRAI